VLPVPRRPHIHVEDSICSHENHHAGEIPEYVRLIGQLETGQLLIDRNG
jgi:hypothetical protein